jgi:hypothetical protein
VDVQAVTQVDRACLPLRSFSYGGGVQSTAALVLAVRGEIDYPLFLFANVGSDSEHPATLRYVAEVAVPYAARNGVELVELQKRTRDGAAQTLLERMRKTERSIPIPMRMGKDGAPGNRTCTSEFKIRVIEKELRRRGATKDNKATVGLGISLDEYQRMRSADDPRSPYQLRHYPLIEARLTRQDCLNIIADEGLPTPGRSSCFFCPFHTADEWQRLARTRPDLFDQACGIEALLHERGKALGRGAFYMTRHGAPLREVYDGNQTTIFDDEEAGCESGYCMT